MRDGLAWSSLDKYIKNIEGGAAGASPLQPHSSEPQAAAAVTAAAVADNEEDMDASQGMMNAKEYNCAGMSSTGRYSQGHLSGGTICMDAVPLQQPRLLSRC